MPFCHYCKCEVPKGRAQLCIDHEPDRWTTLSEAGANPRMWCDPETVYQGFKFITDLDGEQHRFAIELRAAHFHVVEIGNRVIVEAEDPADFVDIDNIRRRLFGDFKSRVIADAISITEQQLIEYEKEVARGNQS